MPAPGTQLYFIAIIPPPPIYDEALKVKEYIRDTYQSKGALNSPPHVTLHMPFEWKGKKEEKLLDSLNQFAKGKEAFALTLNNYSCFEPRVIFIDVTLNEKLNQLQASLFRFCKVELNLFNAQYRDLPFHPHLTVAFRDLRQAQFALAWEEFKSKPFHAEFAVDKITLLKHNGKHWLPFRDFHF